MRILHVIGTADPRSGGPIEGARQAGAVWAKAGHRQDLVTLDSPDAPFLHTPGGTVFAMGPRKSRYGFAPRFLPWLRAHATEYDAVLVAGLWNYSVLAARIALAGGKVPYFVYTHGMLDPWFRRRSRAKAAVKQGSWLVTEGPLLRGARKVLFTTEEERRLAQGAFWPYRVTGEVVGYGTAAPPAHDPRQEAAFRATLPDRVGRYLLSLGRLHPKKGCDLLIEGFARSAPADLALVLAGPGDPSLIAALKATAQRLGIVARVHFTGMLEGDAKWGALYGCEALALTSHQENFGVVLAEACACGRPVLISNKVNIWREVAAAGAGLVAPDTVDGAADLLTRLSALSPADRTAMGAAGIRLFAERYRIEIVANRLLDVLTAGVARPN